MQSDIVVISWWSNCLGLKCLNKLCDFTESMNIYVVQVGKTEEQKELFRYYMPNRIKEIIYPSDKSAEHWCICEYLIYQTFKTNDGLWFVDHDLFILEPFEKWLQNMDRHFEDSKICFCYPLEENSSSITNPAFWISPSRLPKGISSLAPIPAPKYSIANTPYKDKSSCGVVKPQKDTFILVKEELERLSLAGNYPLRTISPESTNDLQFPRYSHLGHLSIFTWENIPKHLTKMCKNIVSQYNAFLKECPPEWRSIEDTQLKMRLNELKIQLGIC